MPRKIMSTQQKRQGKNSFTEKDAEAGRAGEANEARNIE